MFQATCLQRNYIRSPEFKTIFQSAQEQVKGMSSTCEPTIVGKTAPLIYALVHA